MRSSWTIEVDGTVLKPASFTYEEFRRMDDETVEPEKWVPGVKGNALRLQVLLRRVGLRLDTTHLRFWGADDFQAEIPVTDLQDAFLLYRKNGRPLKKGYPVRLYVPQGESNCLNVKSIVRVEAVAYEGADAKKPATFGFRNIIRPEELLQPDFSGSVLKQR
ncbi:molybdopterin-dependent oxidoreductase [Polycladomyces sp. WAk]|uniref:Molybdopterin-dependent oxidoreductase n=1 Tax=Polycladomyces zharkentensis TaxID=2807616 RepID=A0ABS2WKC4_9BACL|nr:molybdopterin-dependent oxidoreductase [Polycladomyces sp. WAk]MBN2910012.1 molybdopterin-dependent oxidoreductase [Polycladomyces sp. WAk]